MKKLNFLILLLIMLLFSIQLNALTLQLKRVVKINEEIITVNDLVESWDGKHTDYLKIQKIVIDELPYERRIMNIQSNFVTQRIKLFNPEVEVNIPSTITAVRWNEVNLNNETIKREAVNFLTQYYSLSDNSSISFMNMPRVSIPSENITLSFSKNRTTENTNYIRLDGKVFYKGELINVFNLLAKVEEVKLVYQANRSIRKGQKIVLNDFIKVSIPANPNNAYLHDFDDSKDFIANNFISKGSYLKNTDIVSPPFVQRNDLVTVLIQSVSMQLSYQAISRANGWLGDRIMLQNPDSKQTFYAEVIDKNKVLINLED